MKSCIEVVSPWWNWHPPVGVFIAVLGLLGILVPLFRLWEQIRKKEKAIWTLVMFVLLLLELRTLYLDRNEHDQEQALDRCRYLKSFEDIAKTLEKSIELGKGEYSSTIHSVNGVLQTTQQVANLANQNLKNITGGDSYAYVYPSTIDEGDESVQLNVHNYGKYPLSGVVVTIYRVVAGATNPDSTEPYSRMEGSEPVNIGSLAPQEGRTVPVPYGRLHPKPSDHYRIWINAQNSGVQEYLEFRPSQSGKSWAYRLAAWRFVTGKPEKTDLFVPNEHGWIRYLKQIDWIEPRKVRPPQ
jgi:hypothetical protein